jgi:hypothetical protein
LHDLDGLQLDDRCFLRDGHHFGCRSVDGLGGKLGFFESGSGFIDLERGRF